MKIKIFLRKIKFRVSSFIGIILTPFFWLIPIDNKKIYCSNFDGNGFSESPKYIALELLKRKKYKIIWSVFKKEENTLPKDIIKVRPRSISYFYHIATSKIWISSSRLPYYVLKRKGQIYIHTWHAPIALKKIEYDAFDKLPKGYQKTMKHDNNMIDVMLSNSNFTTNIYRNTFKYNGKILMTGTPKWDLIINDAKNMKNKVYDYFKLDKKVKILLYAPTFRKEYKNNPYDINFGKIKKILEEKTKNKWVIMIKLHPNAKEKMDLIKNKSEIIDVNTYSSTEELLCASDLLITDYSSLMFDAIVANVPCMLYANDINSYVDERGFYFDLFDMPFPLLQNNGELEKFLKVYKREDIMKNYQKFIKEFELIIDGKASKKVCDFIENNL